MNRSLLPVFIWSLIFHLFPTMLYAQNYSKRHITVNDGLPSNETFCLYQKGLGELYIGTEFGLVLYDGEEFKQIPFEENKYSGSMVFEIRPDKENVLWIKTYRDGLFYLHKDTLRTFIGNENIRNILKEKEPGAMLFDKENIWFTFSFYTDTICKISKKTGEITKVPIGNKIQVPDARIIIYEIGPSAHLVVNTSDKSDCINKKIRVNRLGQAISISSCNRPMLRSACRPHTFFKDSSGFYIAIGKELHRWNNRTNSMEVKTFDSEILYLHNDRRDNLLLGCRQGAFLLNKKNNNVTCLVEKQQVSSLLQDIEGTYWFTTNNGLINMPSTNIFLLDQKNQAHNILTMAGNGERLATVRLTGSVEIFNAGKETVTIQKTLKKKLDKASPKRMFWLNEEQLVYSHALINLSSGKEHWLLNHLNGAIMNFEPGEKEGFLLFAYKRGFTKFNSNLAAQDQDIRVQCPELFCRAICETGGRIYLGTDQGLYVSVGGEAKSLFPEQVHFQINAIKAANNGNLVIATRGGGIFIIAGSEIRQINAEMGLSSNFCTSIFLEAENTVWVGSNRGLNRINFQSGVPIIDKWFTEDGLISDKINVLTMAGNYLFVLTDQGINYFDPKKISGSVPKLQIDLKDIKIGGVSVTSESNLLNIKPGERDIRFEFKTLGFKKGKNIQLRYVLHGKDQVLSQTGGNNILYKDLTPGEYSLKVQAIGPAGAALGPALDYDIFIEPHIYETQTFWVLLISGIIALIVGFVLVYLRRSEKERRRKWEYANAQLEALNLQMNPHFIFNALGNIQSLVWGENKMLANSFVVGLSELFRKVLINANTSLITLATEIEMLREYIELEKIRIEEDIFDYRIEIDPKLQLQQERIPPMLVQPLVENAIWHGLLPAERKGQLFIRFLKVEKGFEIEVTDDGVGISSQKGIFLSKNKNRPSLGLDNVKKRISLYETMGFGKAHLIISDLKESNSGDTGTGVLLHFEK